MTFFFDECISIKLVRILREVGSEGDLEFIHQKEPKGFGAGTPDVQWLPELGKRGYVLVTADLRIRSRQHEATALKASKVTSFFMFKSFADQSKIEQAISLLRAWSNILEAARHCRTGVCHDVKENGRIVVFEMK